MPHVHHAGTGFSVWITLTITFAGLVYLRAWPQRPVWRTASFLVGLFSLWLALGSPIASLDHAMLTGHMIQHLLLMTIAPPLIWLGVKRSAIDRPRFLREHQPPLQLCWLAATATLVVWHVPSVFALGMQSQAWHSVEQISFLATGLLFWWPVVVPWPGLSGWTLILYLFLATLPCDILSGFLVFSDRVAYAAYLSTSPQSALSDQQYAGALMWTCVTVVYLVAAAILSTQLLSAERSLHPEAL